MVDLSQEDLSTLQGCNRARQKVEKAFAEKEITSEQRKQLQASILYSVFLLSLKSNLKKK